METMMPNGFDLRYCGRDRAGAVAAKLLLLPPNEGEDDNFLSDYPITQSNKLLTSFLASFLP
jgi:hypothetical protein